ncbi:MAG: putative bifunctional diguanylate cyclase/phosphodiesterase, partial [Hyphomonadaceae bacterium]
MSGNQSASQRTAKAVGAHDREAVLRRFAFVADMRAEGLEDICAHARDIFQVSDALVTLVGSSETRILAPGATRAVSGLGYCRETIRSDDVFVLNATGHDARLAAYSAEGRRFSFYAGAPLCIEEWGRVGALCLLDANPRAFSPLGKERLRRFAASAARALAREREFHDIRRREALYAQAVHLAKIGCFEIDLIEDRHMWTEEMYRVHGFEPSDGPTPGAELIATMLHEKDRAWARQAITNPEEDLQVRDIPRRTADGKIRWGRTIVAAERVNGIVTRVYGTGQDTTELHENREEIERLAFRDSLTGLPNRAQFTQQFQIEIARAARNKTNVGLILLDLDHFKDVNDTLGHDAGDALLRSVAEHMTEAYRKSDTIARLGGDEFAIILPDIVGMEDLARPTAKLMELLRHPVEHGDQSFTISASMGGAIYPNDDADAAQLLKNADIALYEAKASGRNRFTSYAPAMRFAVEQRIEVLRDVRRGLAADEFILYYQPVVNIAPSVVTGFEALMRWNHPTRGVLTPEAFGAALEDQDLAPLLCDVTLDGALKQMRAWIDEGVEFGRVAINVSAAQFRTPDLAPKIEARLRHWGVHPDRLTIEVTENVYMGWGADVVGDTVRRLHESGVQIALDDFG